jgi:hypothetical protein
VDSKAFGRDYSTELTVPGRWAMTGRWSFEPDYFMEGPVVVSHYRIGR